MKRRLFVQAFAQGWRHAVPGLPRCRHDGSGRWRRGRSLPRGDCVPFDASHGHRL